MTTTSRDTDPPELPPAFEELVQRNLEWARQFVSRRLRQPLRGDADSIDFVQEAVLSIVRRGVPELPDDEEFRALLSRVLEHDLRDRHRYVHRECRDVGRVLGRLSDTVLRVDPPARSVTSPTARVDRDERQAWIRLALELLGSEDREVIKLREWDELTFEQIGARLEITPAAARMRYQRALPRLARKVEALRLGPRRRS
ncbi:MAG: sigma-70 family RNA polymerase sigma factor [Planctomycetes bacterium]|nr:sigma-70 family RNA polymerase sigma factor [Planctomycetota bacterium]